MATCCVRISSFHNEEVTVAAPRDQLATLRDCPPAAAAAVRELIDRFVPNSCGAVASALGAIAKVGS